MICKACSRPVAMARANCLYCGAALDGESIAGAALAAQKVLQSKSLLHLEANLQTTDSAPRTYFIADTAAGTVETLAELGGVSLWQARQWQSATRYRLLRVSAEDADSGGKDPRVVHRVSEKDVAPRRTPVAVETVDAAAAWALAIRDDPDTKATRRILRPQDVLLIVSAPIKREKADRSAGRKRMDNRLEDNWLVHLHVRGEARPWEIDPLRTAFEGSAQASAHMSTLELVRRFAETVPHEEGFRTFVPALAPGEDPLTDMKNLHSKGKEAKDSKIIVLDNVAQFREYSAWRSALESLMSRTGAESSV
jgi:hypothetical protein